MRWAVQWARRGVPKETRKWRILAETESNSRDEAVAMMKEWQEHDPQYEHRLVRLVPKSEKLRMAIVKELRAVAEEHSLYVSEDDEKWAHSSQTLEAMADRIERGEVG